MLGYEPSDGGSSPSVGAKSPCRLKARIAGFQSADEGSTPSGDAVETSMRRCAVWTLWVSTSRPLVGSSSMEHARPETGRARSTLGSHALLGVAGSTPATGLTIRVAQLGRALDCRSRMGRPSPTVTSAERSRHSIRSRLLRRAWRPRYRPEVRVACDASDHRCGDHR